VDGACFAAFALVDRIATANILLFQNLLFSIFLGGNYSPPRTSTEEEHQQEGHKDPRRVEAASHILLRWQEVSGKAFG
jgi:hypothetical protein